MRFVLWLVISAALAAPALANDSSAELGTGGLVLVKSADIEMRSEDLSISEREIVARYRHTNFTPKRDLDILILYRAQL